MIERRNSRERSCDRARSVANLSPIPSPEQNGAGGCKDLLYSLQALDFSLTDTVLYLDAYPESKEAMNYYNKLMSEREALVRALSEGCHSPVTHLDNKGSSWDWGKGPWPWEASAN